MMKELENIRPKVAISCLVYNHEPYLRKCLDGFVMQQTDFPFVAFVHDDCSTDQSAKIIAEYARKYPDIIVPMYETENQYQYNRRTGIIVETACKNSGAKYIAECEGDDYWTDPLKLQKQVDYLEANEDCVMCCHNAWLINDIEQYEFIDLLVQEHDILLNELLSSWRVPTASLLYRINVEKRVPREKAFANGDYYLLLRMRSQGKIHYDPTVMSVYRMHGDSVSAEMNRNLEKMYKNIIDLLQYVRSLYPSPEDQLLFDKAVEKYQHLIWDYQISNHPIKKWFYRKTYTRAIKSWIGKK